MGRRKLTKVFCRSCERYLNREDFMLRKTGERKGHISNRYCRECQKSLLSIYDGNDRGYVAFKKDMCIVCGFKGHPCQLDVHHVDGDHRNNNIENLETLCANCHRLITYYKKID